MRKRQLPPRPRRRDRQPRLDRLQKRQGTGSFAAVMRHFQHIHRLQLTARQQRPLRPLLDIAGQQHAKRRGFDQHHQRTVVQPQIRMRRALRRWPQHLQLRATTGKLPRTLKTWRKIPPQRPLLLQFRQQLGMLRAARRLPIPPEFPHLQLFGHRQQPVFMVRMGVGQNHPIQPRDSAILQPRQHRQLPHAPAIAHFAACVDQRPRPVVALQQRRVAMTHVQPGQPQRVIG